MARVESGTITISRGHSATEEVDADRTIVWVRGEHDLVTKAALLAAVVDAARLARAGVLVDLSDVTFMDASTVGALIGSRNRLRTSSVELQVRAPSARARRVLHLCGVSHLIVGEHSDFTVPSDMATHVHRGGP